MLFRERGLSGYLREKWVLKVPMSLVFVLNCAILQVNSEI